MEPRFHRRVQADLDEILGKYYGVSHQLGEDFFAEFQVGVRKAVENPRYFHFDRSGLHRCNLDRFPYQLSHSPAAGKALLRPEDCEEFLKEGKPFHFDLYRIPYNNGKGGTPEPLRGASGNGRSNYFPRYSPDGRWIVFCQARNYMLLQSDSELFIIPAAGGAARRLNGNTARMNSWHSWSPNSRWLVFSSKADSPYTQLFLTHIDEQGESSPAVCLAHMTAPDRAANIPEFVDVSPQAIRHITARFLHDYSHARAGFVCESTGDFD